MINIRPILFVLGLLLIVLGLTMFVPTIIEITNNFKESQKFIYSSGITIFFGLLLFATNYRQKISSLTIKDAFLLTSLSWLIIVLFSSIPFMLTSISLDFTNAFFEAMSGITTTGSTIITNLDEQSKGILIWRAMLQWFGGIGIIVMAIGILPALKIGGMQLFRMQLDDGSEKILPRTSKIATSIFLVYLALTIICTACFFLSGMNLFNSVAHAMTTISTGGFSTFDKSIGHFNSSFIEYTTIIFMILGSLPFLLYLKMVTGKQNSITRDSQVKLFLFVLLISALSIFVYRYISVDNLQILETFRHSLFSVTSIMTGTGYTTTNFGLWGNFAGVLFIFIMFIGGCAGSTTCGIKVFRFQILFESVSIQIKQLLHPHGVFVPHYNNKSISEAIVSSVISFFLIFVLAFLVLTIGLILLNLDFLTAFTAAATSLSNVGPGLGHIIGPDGDFQSLSHSVKWLLSLGMFFGRLELITVLILFLPSFWQKV